MLLRLDTAAAGGLFTEVQKLADCVPEFCELLITGCGDIVRRSF